MAEKKNSVKFSLDSWDTEDRNVFCNKEWSDSKENLVSLILWQSPRPSQLYPRILFQPWQLPTNVFSVTSKSSQNATAGHLRSPAPCHSISSPPWHLLLITEDYVRSCVVFFSWSNRSHKWTVSPWPRKLLSIHHACLKSDYEQASYFSLWTDLWSSLICKSGTAVREMG